MNTTSIVIKPGTGWKHIAGPVWEHTTKARVHLGGTIRLPDKTYRSLYNWRESELGRRLIQINGDNTKRGLMAWALSLINSPTSF